jgi:hypothetical protein
MNPSALTVYRWELRKLRFQKRTYLGLGAAFVVPVLFVVATTLRGGHPEDVGRAEHGGIAFHAPSERAVGELTLALSEAGALVLELAPNRATLEDLFFALTEGDGDAAPAAATAVVETAA